MQLWLHYELAFHPSVAEPAATPMVAEVVPETADATPPPAEPSAVEEKPAKAVAAG